MLKKNQACYRNNVLSCWPDMNNGYKEFITFLLTYLTFPVSQSKNFDQHAALHF